LRESEAKARAILDTAVDAIITIDALGMVESFNKAAERLFGYEPADVIGKNVSLLMPEPFRTQHDGYLRAYLRPAGPRSSASAAK
jgi:PAS domain S-box-containing protein